MKDGLAIGRLADAAGATVETIRYYQRRGLVAKPDRPLNGTRRYSTDAVRRVRFIKRAQALGFTLEEIAILVALDQASACAETREMAAGKLAVIQSKILELRAMRRALAALMRECDAGSRQEGCPIIRALAAD